MLAYTYIEQGKFELREKPIPEIKDSRDAIVRVTLGSICSSDLHIKHGSVPRAVSGITVGHEMVGVVEKVGADVTVVKPGDRVTVNVETFCGECFFCRRGYVNNCTDPNGGWALGCRIDGGQAEYVRVPYADRGLNHIPDTVSDEQALLVGDVLATGFWASRISEITEDDTENMEVRKICQWCGKPFIAQKTTTCYCSHQCSNLGYKECIRERKWQLKRLQELLQPRQAAEGQDFFSFAQAAKLMGVTRQYIYI